MQIIDVQFKTRNMLHLFPNIDKGGNFHHFGLDSFNFNGYLVDIVHLLTFYKQMDPSGIIHIKMPFYFDSMEHHYEFKIYH